MVLEAFADTIIPGAKRYPDDRAVAGAADDPGAVAAGAVELVEHPAGGLSPALDAMVYTLNEHAAAYAAEHGLSLDGSVPPFVGLRFDARTDLVQQLCDPAHPEKQMWVGLALFSYMAYDSAAHLSTGQALAAGHPGLRAMGMMEPDPDGLWRFPSFTYGTALADLHPLTTPAGSPS
jgi:hypothetical protein